MNFIKFLKFITLGIAFGIVLAKAEIISWFRIYEMFKFQSFHMYGVIGSAVVIGIIGVQIMKYQKVKSYYNEDLELQPKKMQVARYLLGGGIFGMGWALSGACPGPLFILVGYGYYSIIIVILSALVGTFVYGLLYKILPH